MMMRILSRSSMQILDFPAKVVKGQWKSFEFLGDLAIVQCMSLEIIKFLQSPWKLGRHTRQILEKHWAIHQNPWKSHKLLGNLGIMHSRSWKSVHILQDLMRSGLHARKFWQNPGNLAIMLCISWKNTRGTGHFSCQGTPILEFAQDHCEISRSHPPSWRDQLHTQIPKQPQFLDTNLLAEHRHVMALHRYTKISGGIEHAVQNPMVHFSFHAPYLEKCFQNLISTGVMHVGWALHGFRWIWMLAEDFWLGGRCPLVATIWAPGCTTMLAFTVRWVPACTALLEFTVFWVPRCANMLEFALVWAARCTKPEKLKHFQLMVGLVIQGPCLSTLLGRSLSSCRCRWEERWRCCDWQICSSDFCGQASLPQALGRQI